ncbi:uncharacterized protein OCT59_022790 [Rhizophagus irregularis]|uniref:uncharacterized protein n=1 Tax=Rhizophagus irregularis TaxID=588596 RepID=UPI00332C00F4|nr:hypothetical protein OCT59_022790 [Rhizophagus irregularis]
MNDYFKKQNPSSFSFLNFLCFKLLYENERPSWKSKKEEFELYCRNLNLYLRDQVVNEDLREKWSELIESQVWYLFWDPSTACFTRDPKRILVQLALLVVPVSSLNNHQEEKDSQEVQTLWKGVMSNTGGITFYYFMDDLKKDLEHNMETVLDEEKEELDNQILLQEVKDRYETLASESTYEIICRISEKMKSIDLAKLSFNNPLLSFILDLDRIDPIINDLIPKSLLEEASQYENVRNWKGFTTEFIKKEVWDRGRYQNKLKDDCSILEDTHIHEIMHNILYNTIKVSNGKIAIDWQLKQTTFQSRNIPDWIAQYRIGDFLYEFLYGEAASPPYQSTTVRTEGNRWKLIHFMSRSVRRAKEKLVSQFSNIADGDLMDDVRNIPRFGMLLYGTNLKILYYDKSKYRFGVITTLMNIQLPLHSQVDKNLVKNYLIGLVIFRRGILGAIEGMKKLSERCNNHMIAQQNNLYIICNDDDEKEDIYPSPQRMKRVKLNNAIY